MIFAGVSGADGLGRAEEFFSDMKTYLHGTECQISAFRWIKPGSRQGKNGKVRYDKLNKQNLDTFLLLWREKKHRLSNLGAKSASLVIAPYPVFTDPFCRMISLVQSVPGCRRRTSVRMIKQDFLCVWCALPAKADWRRLPHLRNEGD